MEKWLNEKIFIRFDYYGQQKKVYRVLKQDDNGYYVVWNKHRVYLTSNKVEDEFLTWKGVY